ncbi:MAG: hypothetical protein HQM10_04710 [Candidatus Riflebacteria bacterium]|nr:hypothetical protein [Candidatus Riflebacteria bacterium]
MRSKFSVILVLILIFSLYTSKIIFAEDEDKKRIVEIQSFNSDELSRIKISLSEPIEPLIRYISRECLWQIDFPGVTSAVNLAPTASQKSPVRLIRFSEIREPALHTKVFFHVKPESSMKVIRESDGIVFLFRHNNVRLANNNNSFSGDHFSERLPNSLVAPTLPEQASSDSVISAPVMHLSANNEKESALKIFDKPGPEISEEIVLNLKNASTREIFFELSKQAGIKIRFRTPPPEKITYRGRENSALHALGKLAQQAGMVLTRESDLWCLTDHKHPILLIPADEIIKGEKIEGMIFREALEKIAGHEVAERFLSSCSESEYHKRITGVSNLSASPRILIEYLLNCRFVSIDNNIDYSKL